MKICTLKMRITLSVMKIRVCYLRSINWDVAFVVHIHVGIVAVVMYREYKEDSHVDAQYYSNTHSA